MNAILYFNPRTPVGCDGSGFITGTTFLISIHAPQWGATSGPSQILPSKPFQSTHPSGVRLPGAAHVVIDGTISIHAPQWGATSSSCSSSNGPPNFNPRTPVGCDPEATGRRPSLRYFNPRTPVGCDPSSIALAIPSNHFNPRTPVGCDFQVIHAAERFTYFNPRTPVGCDTVASGVTPANYTFQSTHPSGVRLAPHEHSLFSFPISIHAPQWGATQQRHAGQGGRSISIHAPQWGATNAYPSHTGSRKISIHAPQWGATGRHQPTALHQRDFNPRTPVGCDWDAHPAVSYYSTFQSTHPSGVRRPVGRAGQHVHEISIHAPQWGATIPRSDARTVPADFNPRTPVGCDSCVRDNAAYIDISIHAPQWGATACVLRSRFVSRISIHAPQWGATRGLRGGKPHGHVDFNPRTPVGCDSGKCPLPACSEDFNPRTPVGCDLVKTMGCRLIAEFQSTHPSGVRLSRCVSCITVFTISIHAPQWGATWAYGARYTESKHFNPRTPVGCDHENGHSIP